MITFIRESEIEEVLLDYDIRRKEIISSIMGPNALSDNPIDSLSKHANGPRSIQAFYYAVSSSDNVSIKPFKMCDLSQTTTTFIYPIFVRHMYEIFNTLDNSIFNFISPEIIKAARHSKLYIAFFQSCEGFYVTDKIITKLKRILFHHKIPIKNIIIGTASTQKRAIGYEYDLLYYNWFSLKTSYYYNNRSVNIPKENKKQKHYICLNHMPRLHRYHLVEKLHRERLDELGNISCFSINFCSRSYVYPNDKVLFDHIDKFTDIERGAFIWFYENYVNKNKFF